MQIEKKGLFIFVVVAVFVVAIAALGYQAYRLDKEAKALKALNKEMSDNFATLAVMSQSVKIMQKRLEEGRNKSFNAEMEKISTELGLNKNLKKVAASGTKKEGLLNVSLYELKYEGLDINSVVNLLYRILNAPMLVRVERCNMAVSFDNPGLINVSLTVAHII